MTDTVADGIAWENLAAELPGGGQFHSTDSLLLVQFSALVPENGEENDDGENAEPESEKSAFEYLVLQALTSDKGTGGGCGLRDGQHGGSPVVHADLLTRALLIADRQFHLRHGHDGGGVPLVPSGVPPDMPGRDHYHRDGSQDHSGTKELAPHEDAVEDRLSVPEGAVPDTCFHHEYPGSLDRQHSAIHLASPAVVVHRDRPFPASLIRTNRILSCVLRTDDKIVELSRAKTAADFYGECNAGDGAGR